MNGAKTINQQLPHKASILQLLDWSVGNTRNKADHPSIQTHSLSNYLIGEVTKHRAVQMSHYENVNLYVSLIAMPILSESYAPLLVCIITVL